ncbi:hypothetical protein SADUNF_Sadunf04G0010000 [Salix dunnii]|uniref:Uncharacterized protein n=1 Tax=Salix dunnii TaxID=1413687 RepID=A0A835N024_9ROSI|nr:hypothetical protein SADUNF_Sadunf04G0010000 [Salix dunnii]
MLTMEVQLISRKLIKPSVQTPPHLQNLNISFLDQLAPSLYIPSIFYYPNHHHESIKNIDKLEKSLSEILTLFYPLAGRYIEDNLSVNCNDEGVEFLEAKVDGVDLTQIIQQDPNSNLDLLDHLVPCVTESDTSRLLAIQINKFKCGGLAIGLLSSHRIADMPTTSTFINAWATTFREGGISDQVPRPRFDCSFLFPQRDLRLSLPPPPKIQPKIVTKVFVLNKEAIDKLKSKLSGGTDSGVKYHPSRLEVVTALIWKALIGSAKSQHGHLRASSLRQIMTLRGRVGMPLPENACGNIYMPFISRFIPNDKSNRLQFSDIASLLRDSKRKAISDCANGVDSDDVLSMVTNSHKELIEELNKGEVDTYKFTSWCRLGLEKVNFGWGEPAWTSAMNFPIEISILKDSKFGDGIEAWMTLKEIDMLLFQQDPDIMALTSSQE